MLISSAHPAHDPRATWRAPTLYPGVFVARSGAAVGRIDGIERGAGGLRFTMTVWPGRPQRLDVVMQPWEGDGDSVRGVLSVASDGIEYTLPPAQVHVGHGEGDVPEEWVGPDRTATQGPHLRLNGYGQLDLDGSFTAWPELRPTPETVRHLDVRLTVAELDIELTWSIDLDEPAYTAPAEDAASPAEDLDERARFTRPTLLTTIETTETALATGRLDCFSLARGTLSFRQTIWAHPDTLGLLFRDDLWFERDDGPAGHFTVTVGGSTHHGTNGRGRSSRLTMTDARMSRDRVSVDWSLTLNGVRKDAYLARPIACELIDPAAALEMRWVFQLR